LLSLILDNAIRHNQGARSAFGQRHDATYSRVPTLYANRRHRRLLRTRRQRPRGRAADKRDELAPVHSITSSARPSCFRVGMTRLVNEQNIRTPQRIENRACNDPGILTTDTKPISCGLPSMRVMCLKYSIRN
jgi:hypothetical protein